MVFLSSFPLFLGGFMFSSSVWFLIALVNFGLMIFAIMTSRGLAKTCRDLAQENRKLRGCIQMCDVVPPGFTQ